MKLNKYYSIDECKDEEVLFNKLDKLKEEGKIEYQKNDKWSIKVTDIDLSTKEEEDIIKLFDSLDLYPTDGEEELDDDYFYDEEEGEVDNYKPRKGGYDDDFNDF